jgi:hypothetical protein
MAKQTFTTGQVLTADNMTSLQQTAMGGGSATAKTASYTLVTADAGSTVIMNSGSATTITVDTALFAAGDTVFIVNQGAGVCTITAGTATVSSAGSLAMGENETGQLYFLSTSAAIFTEYTQSAAAGGKILQVVQATYATPTTTTSTSYVDSGLTVSITPSSASSKILCIVSHHFRIGNSGAKSRGFVQLVRDSTAIWTSTSTDYLTITSDGSYAEFGWGYTFSYLDSPATTSATTYKTQQRCYAGNVDSPSVTSHAGQSGIIVMEVGA